MRVSTSTGAALHIYFTPFPPTLHPKHTHVSLTTLHPSPLTGYLRWPERAIDRESEEHVRSQRRLKECLGADPRGEPLRWTPELSDFHDLILRLLEYMPEHRMTAAGAMQHPFVQRAMRNGHYGGGGSNGGTAAVSSAALAAAPAPAASASASETTERPAQPTPPMANPPTAEPPPPAAAPCGEEDPTAGDD